MAHFYICHSRDNPSPQPKADLDEGELDLPKAGRYLSSVALKVPDVRIKLGLAKVTHLLEETHSKLTSLIVNQQKESAVQIRQSYPSNASEFSHCDKENIPQQIDPSFVRISTSKSFLTEPQPSQIRFPERKDQHRNSQLVQAFEWRQVVTKNVLDEPDRQPRVRFREQLNSLHSSQMLQMHMKEHLQGQNEMLERCLKNMFTFFEERQLLPFEIHSQLQDSSKYEAITQELSRNFVSYQEQNEQRFACLHTESVNLQQTIENMSTSLKIEPDRVEKTKHEGVQADSMGEEMRELSRQLEKVSQNCQKYEMLLHIKEEKISSLKVLVSDYENRLNNLGKSESKVRSRSYKKYFDGGANNLSATVS